MTEVPILSIPGFEIGSAENRDALTGCTVVICREGAVAGVDVRGGSPGTRETDALDPVNLRQSIHAVLLAGGSAFGLDAAAGVMRYLEERGIGRDVGVTRVPIVCGAILFDLKCGDWRVRPDADMGYAACEEAHRQHGPQATEMQHATTEQRHAPMKQQYATTEQQHATTAGVRQGNAGAGMGATVGKVRGTGRAMKSGLGAACFKEGALLVGAVMAVNCVGDVIDPETGKILAGVLSEDGTERVGSENELLAEYQDRTDFFSGNTIIGTVITNARLTKAEANRLATVSHNGIARAVRPAHSVFDGDTIFTMATGTVEANADVTGILAVRAVERAITNAVRNAETAGGYRAWKDMR